MLLKFKVDDHVRVLGHGDEIGVIIDVDGSDIPYKIKFKDGYVAWRKECYIESVKEGLHVEQLIGKWAYRIGRTASGDNSCQLTAAGKPCTSAPAKILSIDERGIHYHGLPEWCSGTEDAFPLAFLDDQWAEWIEPPIKFPVGSRVITVKRLDGAADYLPVGSKGTVTCLHSVKHRTVLFDKDRTEWFAELEMLETYDPDKDQVRPLWEQALKRYTKIREVAAGLCEGIRSASNHLDIPACAFCKRKGAEHYKCDECPWQLAMGKSGDVACSNTWAELNDAARKVLSLTAPVLEEIKAQLK